MGGPIIIIAGLGATGTKAAAFDFKGCLIVGAYEETRLIYPKPGLVEQDRDEFYASAFSRIKETVRKGGLI
jgi:glycerol kinase